jgi:hypothetical protein
MDVGTVVSWIQLVLWSFAVVVGSIKLVKRWRKEGFKESISLPQKGIVSLLLLGLIVSSVSLYFNYRPRVVQVEKIVEKPVDRIVEKLVPQECPKCNTPKKASPQVASPAQPNTGSISQGAGSALSFGQQGGITAGTIIGTIEDRIPPDKKPEMIKILSGKPSSAIVFLCRNGNSKLANDWHYVLHEAGWSCGDDVGGFGSSCKGVSFAFANIQATPDGKMFIPADSPEGELLRAAQAANTRIQVGPQGGFRAGLVQIYVGTDPSE